MRLGVISDTHGLFDEAVVSIFTGVTAIIHAGDIGKLEIIDRLQSIAPVLAVEGNNDWFGRFPVERIENIADHRIVIRHIFGELHQLDASALAMVDNLQPDVVVFGHSHRPYAERYGRTLLFNPGSAGPRRFSLPRTVGILEIEGRIPTPQIINLD